MSNASCPHIDGCQMYRLFTLSGTLGAWKINYCTADFARCERHKRASSGQSVPDNLMPNGVLLKKKAGGEK